MWSPVFNSFKFVDQAAEGFLEKNLQDDFSALPYMEGAGYCQKVNLDETRQIQWHTTTALDTVTLKVFETDAVHDTFSTVLVGSGAKRDINGDLTPFDIYQSDIDFDSVGNYYLEIDDGTDTLRSEPIQVGTFADTILMEFTNWKDTELNVWENDFTVTLRAQAQLFRRLPVSTNQLLNDTENFTNVISQRQSRGMLGEFQPNVVYVGQFRYKCVLFLHNFICLIVFFYRNSINI